MQPEFLNSLVSKMEALRLQQTSSHVSSRNSFHCDRPLPPGNFRVDIPIDHDGRLSSHDDSISLEDFKIMAVIGKGSYGKVYLGKVHGNDSKLYAIKALRKKDIIQKNQMEYVQNQKDVLAHVRHPFLLQLKSFFQDAKHFYLVTEYAQGGDLFVRLRKEGRFSNDVGLFYMTELVSAIKYLHDQQIIYRDLKPQNILISQTGHILLADFGFAKHLPHDRTHSICGTPEYLAPQMILCLKSNGKTPYGRAIDWWACGILLFEMLVGFPPFIDKDPMQIYLKVEEGIVQFPRFVQSRAKDLIKKLLNPNPATRLGSSDSGQLVKQHRWFKGVNWQRVKRGEIASPWMPVGRGEQGWQGVTEVD